MYVEVPQHNCATGVIVGSIFFLIIFILARVLFDSCTTYSIINLEFMRKLVLKMEFLDPPLVVSTTLGHYGPRLGIIDVVTLDGKN